MTRNDFPLFGASSVSAPSTATAWSRVSAPALTAQTGASTVGVVSQGEGEIGKLLVSFLVMGNKRRMFVVRTSRRRTVSRACVLGITAVDTRRSLCQVFLGSGCICLPRLRTPCRCWFHRQLVASSSPRRELHMRNHGRRAIIRTLLIL
jgi:hypothetical protein